MKKSLLLCLLLIGSIALVGCQKSEPEVIDSNTIYGGDGDHKVEGNNNIYYNDKYGISFKLGEDSNGGTIREYENEDYNEVLDYDYTEHIISFVMPRDNFFGNDIIFFFTVYDNNQFNKLMNDSERKEEWGKYAKWENNKYKFIFIGDKDAPISDFHVFDVE